MGILSRLFGRDKTSKVIAKERLRLVLIQDRAGIPAEELLQIKNEIIATISKHVRIDQAAIELNLMHSAGQTRLVANIPLAGKRRLPETECESLEP